MSWKMLLGSLSRRILLLGLLGKRGKFCYKGIAFSVYKPQCKKYADLINLDRRSHLFLHHPPLNFLNSAAKVWFYRLGQHHHPRRNLIFGWLNGGECKKLGSVMLKPWCYWKNLCFKYWLNAWMDGQFVKIIPLHKPFHAAMNFFQP